MKTDVRPLSNSPRWLYGFFFATACAETAQVVATLWATYQLTQNATLVGVVNGAAYLPGVLVGLGLMRRVDRGVAVRLLTVTNWAVLVMSVFMTVCWYATSADVTIIGVFILVQAMQSIVKLLNKGYAGRFIRDRYSSALASRVLGRSASLTVLGGLVGATLAGGLIDLTSPGACFIAASVLFATSIVAVRQAAASASPPLDVPAATPAGHKETASKFVSSRRALLQAVLYFSIPSSGTLPFLSAAMVPLAAAVLPSSPGYYALLTFVAAAGGFLAGWVVSSSDRAFDVTTQYGLAAAGAATIVLALVGSPVAVAAGVFALSVMATAHVITMQVLTNQLPPSQDVGRYTVIRTCIAGTSKTVFSIGAGLLIDHRSLPTAWFTLAAVLVPFSVLWLLVRRQLEVTYE